MCVASINEWVAARVHANTGRVEAVVARLGIGCVEVAAYLVGSRLLSHV